MKKLTLIYLSMTICLPLLADMGSIPFEPGVDIYEPLQRAFIAWNGRDEMMILTTDLRASYPTKVLEIMPFPSEPEVDEGDAGVYHRALRIIREKQPRRHYKARGLGLESSDKLGYLRPPSGTVTFHEQIGAHDISVTKVIRSDGFVPWANRYLRSLGVDTPRIPRRLQRVVEEYIDEGFVWFVFDVVELGTSIKRKDALEFTFCSNYLYYPIRITATEKGMTKIEIIALTRRLFRTFSGISRNEIEMPYRPVIINRDELRRIDRALLRFFRRNDTLYLRLWKINGYPSSFSGDLIAK